MATFNWFLLFVPRIEHRGKVEDEQRKTVPQYTEKISNLSTLIRGYEVLALQETGGRAEIAALAEKAERTDPRSIVTSRSLA